MIYILTGMALLFIATGWVVTEKNAKYILAGYNTMSEEERRRIDLRAYLSYFRRFHLFLGISFLIIGLLLYYLISEAAASIFLGIYPILAYIYFIWRSTSLPVSVQLYGSFSKTWSKAGIFILAGTLVFVSVLMILGYKNDPLLVSSGSIELKGMYGETLARSDIKSIEVVGQLPEITLKVNGFAMGKINKGYFKTSEGERVKLILNSRQPQILLITKTDGSKIYYTGRENTIQNQLDEIKKSLPALEVL